MGKNGKYMNKDKKPAKSTYYDIRVRVPIKLGELFAAEALNERRKHGPQLARILEERYTPIKTGAPDARK